MAKLSPRDSQQTALYTAENDLFRPDGTIRIVRGRAEKTAPGPEWAAAGGREVTQEEARDLVFRALAAQGVPSSFLAGGVRFSKRARARCWYDPSKRQVVFAPFGLEKAFVAVHEAAHVVQDWHGILQTRPYHGREFVRLVVRMYDQMLGVPMDEAERFFRPRLSVARRTWRPVADPGAVFEVDIQLRTKPTFPYRFRAESAEKAEAYVKARRFRPLGAEPCRLYVPF